MSKTRILVATHVEPKQHKALRKLAKESHRTVSAVLRMLIEEKLSHQTDTQNAQ